MMKSGIILASGALALALSGGAQAQEADPALVEAGRYLAIAGDCAACHMDPDSGNPYAGGFGVASPIGVIYGSNITPSETGIGGWSLDQFSAAVRKGRAPGGHFLYPAMPYTAFSGITNDDIKALYSYMMLGVEPVEHEVPKTELGFPFSMRPIMIGWDLLFGGGAPATNVPATGPERGKYLVETLAHCSTCHTPRGDLMEEKMDRFLGGGKVGSWTAPNITSDPDAGIGSWSEDDIYHYLKSGAIHGKAIAGGDMGTAVQNSFSHLTDDDVKSIAAYIKTVPPVTDPSATPRSGWTKSAPVPSAELETPLDVRDYQSLITAAANMPGARLYDGACATCHGYDGRGTPDGRLPSLVGSSAVGSSDPSNLVMTITEGINRTAQGNHAFMAAFGQQLSTQEIAELANYVATSFGDPAHKVTVEDVQRVYAAKSQTNWLIANAALLAWIGIAVAVLFVLLILWRLRAAMRGTRPA